MVGNNKNKRETVQTFKKKTFSFVQLHFLKNLIYDQNNNNLLIFDIFYQDIFSVKHRKNGFTIRIKKTA